MMRKHITRTLTRSVVPAYTVKIVDGKPEIETLEPVTVWGVPTEKKALKAVKDAHGDINGIAVGEIQSTEETYRVTIDDFVTIAERVENQSDENETEEENEEKEGNY